MSLLTPPPVSDDALAVSTVAVWVISAWLVAECAAAAAAPAAIAEISIRPLAALVGCLRCCPPRWATPMTSVTRRLAATGIGSVPSVMVGRASTSLNAAGAASRRRRQIVDLVQIVEFGRQQHPRGVVEVGVVAEVEVAEVDRVVGEVQVVEVEPVEREISVTSLG